MVKSQLQHIKLQSSHTIALQLLHWRRQLHNKRCIFGNSFDKFRVRNKQTEYIENIETIHIHNFQLFLAPIVKY